METADGDLDSTAAELSCEIERPRKLVGLYAHQHHHTGIRFLDRAGQILDPHLPVGLVDRFDVDIEISAENLAVAAIKRDTIEAGQRIRRQTAAPPSDNVTILVVVRRLDQNKPESLACAHKHTGDSRNRGKGGARRQTAADGNSDSVAPVPKRR